MCFITHHLVFDSPVLHCFPPFVICHLLGGSRAEAALSFIMRLSSLSSPLPSLRPATDMSTSTPMSHRSPLHFYKSNYSPSTYPLGIPSSLLH